MSSSLRFVILNEISRSLRNVDSAYMGKIASAITLRQRKDQYSFQLPIKSTSYDIRNNVGDIISKNTNDIFDHVSAEENILCYNVSRDKYIKMVLEKNFFGVAPPVLMESPKNVIVEFSSPNIAKPFHLGHFRSTVIGNYITNINNFMHHEVKKINYLGDWGKQIGFMQIGVSLEKPTEDEMKKNPMQTLYKAYVAAHKKLEVDPSVGEHAQKVFRQLELGDSDVFEQWEMFKNYTVEELSKIYKRLGIIFHEYHWESMYRASQIKDVIAKMEHLKLLSVDENNRKVIHLDNNNVVPIKRSDDTTLYITRDIAAAIDRYEKNKFDIMYYVVDSTQQSHLNNLVEILKKMQMPWASNLKHIRFGRILGMSTRKGTSIFIEDILNELRDIMKKRQQKAATTKVSLSEMDASADILAVTSLLINDLKRRKERDYKFQLEDVIKIAEVGDGSRLQYAHCRLTSLEEKNIAFLSQECDPSYLKEPEIDELLLLIGKFDEVITECYTECQACLLTSYILQLTSALGKLFSVLTVKDQPTDVASNRLLVFHVGRLVLAQSMKILGITPLERM